MARYALHHKGDITEYVTIHSLMNPLTWIPICFTVGWVLVYWWISPKHVVKWI